MSDPVVIIGAGPAGLACASELASANRSVVLIDDNVTAGGQYFRQLPTSYRVAANAKLLRDKSRFDELAKVLNNPAVRCLPSTTVWGNPSDRTVAFAGSAGSGRVKASAIVIATGAQDRSLPFTGWTLPGVISAGGCLNLAKAHGLIPSGRVVVAGNGPLVLVAAATLIAAGANVVRVIEAQSDFQLLPVALSGLTSAPKILRTGVGYRTRIWQSGAGFQTGRMMAEAKGDCSLQAVAVAPIKPDGQPDRARLEWIEADTLVTGYGLMPATEAARVFGCRIEYDPSLNGLVPCRDAQLRTSEDGIYAIGDGAGIGGVEVALLEGRIAAQAILEKPPSASLLATYHKLDVYRRKLNLAYRMPKPLQAATDDTIICRCEGIRLGSLRNDPNCKRESLNALKTSSRLGMGRCQGRNCLHTASAILQLSVDSPLTYPRMRPPIKPIQIGLLAADADAGPALEPDEINLSAKDET